MDEELRQPADKDKTEQWSRMPGPAVRDPRFNRRPAAFRTLAAIGLHADEQGKAFPSIETLTEITGLDRVTVHRSVKLLSEWGYIERDSQVPRYKLGKPLGGYMTHYKINYSATPLAATAAPLPKTLRRRRNLTTATSGQKIGLVGSRATATAASTSLAKPSSTVAPEAEARRHPRPDHVGSGVRGTVAPEPTNHLRDHLKEHPKEQHTPPAAAFGDVVQTKDDEKDRREEASRRLQLMEQDRLEREAATERLNRDLVSNDLLIALLEAPDNEAIETAARAEERKSPGAGIRIVLERLRTAHDARVAA